MLFLDYQKLSFKMSGITSRVMRKLAESGQAKRQESIPVLAIPNSLRLKIAQKKERNKSVGTESSAAGATAALGMGAGMLGGGALLGGAQIVADKGLFDQGNEQNTSKVLRKLQKVEGAAGLPVKYVPTEAQSMYIPPQANYTKHLTRKSPLRVREMLDKERLFLPKSVNPFITAHEVGHASGGGAAKALMRHRLPITVLSRLGGLGLLGHAALTGEKGEGMSATGYAAPAVSAVAPALVQGEELRATLKARSMLNKAKIKVPGLGKLMRAQQLNYLLGNLGKVAPVGVGALALHHYLKPKDKGN